MSEWIVEEFDHAGLHIKIMPDDDPINPRTDYDPFGHMVCFHRRYNLGDKHSYHEGDFSGWQDLASTLTEEEGAVIILPLYLYDHSGITMSTGTFSHIDSAGWDWGCTGLIYATEKDILENYLATELTEDLKQKATDLLESEVRVYDLFLTGQCYGYIVEDQDGNHLDSCWGFLGDVAEVRAEAISAAESEAAYLGRQWDHAVEVLNGAPDTILIG